MFRNDCFPTPIWFEDLDIVSDDITDSISSKWIEFSEKYPFESRHISNVGGWQSQELYRDDCDIQEKILLDLIDNGVKQVTREYLKYNEVELSSWWVNINRYSNYNLQHKHPGSVLSGVFYLKVPSIDTGSIIFYRDSNDFLLHWHTKMNNHLNNTKVIYPPIKKRLMIFPAWFEHAVEPNMSNEERISISFNYDVKK